MARWMEAYRVGEAVEYLTPMASKEMGRKWIAGYVVRKTATGLPIVDLNDVGMCFEARRKDDIRKASTSLADRLWGLKAEQLAELHDHLIAVAVTANDLTQHRIHATERSAEKENALFDALQALKEAEKDIRR